MKFIKVIATFETNTIPLAEEIICDIFFSYNLKGVVCDVPIQEPDEGFGTNTLVPLENYSITGFFPFIESSHAIVKNIVKKTTELSKIDINVVVTTQVVDENDWADAWKDFFEVTPITKKIIVKPDWKHYQEKKGEIIIHLDPGMAFGTGTHPTTFMCIQLIENYLKPGNSFLDIGTGSGILMIAAAKLGATELTGIDTDEVAIDVAKKNLKKNDIPDDIIRLTCTTLDQIKKTPYDLIAANIIAQVIVDIAPQIAQRMHKETIAILSGIIQERLPDVLDALESSKLEVIEKTLTDEWVALAVQKRERG